MYRWRLEHRDDGRICAAMRSSSTSTATLISSGTSTRSRSRSASRSSLRRAITTGGGYDHRTEVVVLNSSDIPDVDVLSPFGYK